MTITDEMVERAGGPSDAELAEHLRGMAEWISERGGWQSDDIEWVYLAAQRLEVRSEISEAEAAKVADAVLRAAGARLDMYVMHGSREKIVGAARAALEAALSGEKDDTASD